MIAEAKNSSSVYITRFHPSDIDQLVDYLTRLSPDTARRFGPHKFDRHSILEFYNHARKTAGYLAYDTHRAEIIAYAIICIGYLDHDKPRLQSYGLELSNTADCTFAPSVSDGWQGMGIGSKLFEFILLDLHDMGVKRVILWGGVQADNSRAVNYYKKLKFEILGEFEYNGQNYDMLLNI